MKKPTAPARAKGRLSLVTLFAHVDQPALRDIAKHQLIAGHDRKKVVDDLVAVMDAALPLDFLTSLIPIPGVALVGSILETLDGPLLRLAANAIVTGIEKALAKQAAAA